MRSLHVRIQSALHRDLLIVSFWYIAVAHHSRNSGVSPLFQNASGPYPNPLVYNDANENNMTSDVNLLNVMNL